MDLYEILCVQPDSSTTDIKKSYYKLAKIYHPDKNGGSPEYFHKINYAYNILIDEKSRTKYNTMNKITKNKFINFLEKWFNNQPNIKSLFNISDEVFTNIDSYDFNDILQYFNNNIIAKKQFTETVDCSDSDINCWDELQAEYYEELPLKYHQYNMNNLHLELKCSLDEIIKNRIRQIKIKRKFFDSLDVNTFNFYSNHKYIVFNMGGDINSESSGHLIICLLLPVNYNWNNNNILYRYDIEQWIPYRDGLSIYVTDINSYQFIIKLIIDYTDTSDKKTLLKDMYS